MIVLFGKKLSTSKFFKLNGETLVSTLIKVGPCIVLKKIEKKTGDYTAIQIGYDFCSIKCLSKPQAGFFETCNLIPCTSIYEFLVLNPHTFRIGQVLDTIQLNFTDCLAIKSKTIGKGFSGVIKRHNFVTGPKTHGSKNYKQPGSIGQGTTPGRVFKGKKLAGNLGNSQKTIRNLQLLKIDQHENLILIKGMVSGSSNSILKIFTL